MDRLSSILLAFFLVVAAGLGLTLGLLLSTTTIVCPPFLEEERVVEGTITITDGTEEDQAWLEECFSQFRKIEEEE